jgi:adenylate cyclase
VGRQVADRRRVTEPEPGPESEPLASDTGPWERAGLYDPAEPNARERLALLEYLTRRGATMEQMVEAHRVGALPGVAGDLVTQSTTTLVPLEEIARRSGVELPRVRRALLAVGMPVASDSMVPDDLVGLMEAFEAGTELMGEDAILAFTRVLGASAMNIAEAAVALFWAEFGPGSVSEGPDELARARLSEAATQAFLAVPDIMARAVVGQFERAQRRSQAVRGWSHPSGGDSVGEPGSPTETVALGFVDLVGSTAWSQTLNLREQNLALTRFESAAWSSAVLAEGRVIKMIGDEVFFYAPSVDAACRIGREVCRSAADDEVLPDARGAVGVGPVTPREGDYYGPLVNLLARLVKVGAPGELVATAQAVAILDKDEWTVRPLEPAALPGIPEPVRAYVVEQLGSGA